MASVTPKVDAEPDETTDEEALWADPNAWDFNLCVHQAYYTVHARKTREVLLCSRIDEGQYFSVVNASGAWPVCRTCSARVRAQVERNRSSPEQELGAEPAEPGTDDESYYSDEAEGGESEATPY